MISKRLVPTFETNGSTWWLQIKYNKLALQKKKKNLIQKNEDYKPHDQPHNHHHYQKQKQQQLIYSSRTL